MIPRPVAPALPAAFVERIVPTTPPPLPVIPHAPDREDEPQERVEGLAPVHHGKFSFTSAGLVVRGAPTYEEWAEVGGVLSVMERSIAFLVGDWIRFGEGQYGELAAQAIDARGWTESTVRAYTWLAEKVPAANRMMDRGLSVAHHLAVAALPEPAQRKWLMKASTNGDGVWPVSKLKSAIKAGHDQTEVAWFVMVRCASAAKRDKLMKQLELDGHECKAVTKHGSV